MSRYLRIAEKIYKEIGNNKRFMQEPAEDLNTLMTEIKKAIQGTDLKLVYRYLDFENLMMCSTRSKIHLDLTIIPKTTNSQEFILWLAGFIEKITQGKQIKLPPLDSKFKLPSYATEEISLKPPNNGEDIMAYFQNQEKVN